MISTFWDIAYSIAAYTEETSPLPLASNALIERTLALGFSSLIYESIDVPWPFSSEAIPPITETLVSALAPVSIRAISKPLALGRSSASLKGFSSSVITFFVFTVSAASPSAIERPWSSSMKSTLSFRSV